MSKPNTGGFGLGSKKTALSGHAKSQESAMDFNQRAATSKAKVNVPNSAVLSQPIVNRPANRHLIPGKIPGGK